MNSVAGPERSATRCPGTTAPTAVALLPVFNIPDRAIIAYEAIPRLRAPGDRLSVVRGALEAVRFTTPGVLLVPVLGDLLDTIGVTPAELAAEHGADPSDVAWVISSAADARYADSTEGRSPSFAPPASWSPSRRGGGLQRGTSASPRSDPDFLLLDATSVAQVICSELAGAELAALNSFGARFDVCLIARGVDNATIANALTASGLQHGSGAHLSPPLVLADDLATDGDTVVGPSWFRQHEARTLVTPGRSAAGRTQVVSLSEVASDDATPTPLRRHSVKRHASFRRSTTRIASSVSSAISSAA